VETELWRGYSGTAKRKGRQQTNQTYGHRATSRLYRFRAVNVCFQGGVGAVMNTNRWPNLIGDAHSAGIAVLG